MPTADVKKLYGLAAARCAFPDCRLQLVLEADQGKSRKQIGKIAHIIGHSDDGPRGDATYPREKLDTYDNWILLCPTHHDTVDAKVGVYTVEGLRQLKIEHERWVEQRLSEGLQRVGFAELEVITNAIANNGAMDSVDLTLSHPLAKMQKNGLSARSQWLITMGLCKASEVGRFIEHYSLADANFPDRLKSGFVVEYERLKVQGYRGDDLFDQLREFAGGPSLDFSLQAAGLAVLTYLFERCEIFEK